MSVLKKVTPAGWKPFMSSTHALVYWHHKATKENSWVPPPGTPSLEEALALAAAREAEKTARAQQQREEQDQEKPTAFTNEAAKGMRMVCTSPPARCAAAPKTRPSTVNTSQGVCLKLATSADA